MSVFLGLRRSIYNKVIEKFNVTIAVGIDALAELNCTVVIKP